MDDRARTDSGKAVKIHIPFNGQLDEAKERALQSLNALVATQQKKWLTALPAQPVIYERKAQDAWALLNGTSSHSTWLAHEAKARGISEQELAQAIVDSSKRWAEIGAKIEAVRIKAQSVIRKATANAEAFDAVRTARQELNESSD